MQLANDVKQLSTLEWLKLKLRALLKRNEPSEDVFEKQYDFAEVDPTLFSEIINAAIKAVAAGFIIAPVIQISYSIYASGGLVRMLALSMAGLCASGGNCDEPTLMTSLTVGVLISVAAALIILSPFRLLLGKSQWMRLHEHLELVDDKTETVHADIEMIKEHLAIKAKPDAD